MTFYIYNPLTRNETGANLIDKYPLKTFYDCTDIDVMSKLENSLTINDTIYIIGGDGTIHYLLNNYRFLFKYKIKYFRNGSGNDFYRSLTTKMSYYYTINNTASFINSFGIGFDALVCDKVNQQTKKSKFSYIVQCYKSLKEYEPINLDVVYNGKEYHYKKVWLCSLQNGKYFGGGINIARNAKIDDSEIDLCIGHNLNRLTVLILLLFVKLGLTHLFKKYFFTVKINSLTIKNNNNLLAQLDGDVMYFKDDITLTNKNEIKIEKSLTL